MKKLKIMSLLLLIWTLCFTFISCNKKTEDQNEYTVTFNLMEGKYDNKTDNVVIKNVKANTVIDLITPTKDGFNFQGWTTHLSETMIAEVQTNLKITENTVLYAVWKRPQLKLNTDGGVITKYKNVGEIIDEFMLDISSFLGRTFSNYYQFFNSTYNANFKNFFERYETKWMGLYNYLKAVCLPEHKEGFNKLLTTNDAYIEYGSLIRVEIQGWILKTNYYYADWLFSANFGDLDIQNQIYYYMPNETPNYYIAVSGDYILPTPYKIGYRFIGWYDNSEFSGEKITSIKQGETKNYEFFAKWEEE